MLVSYSTVQYMYIQYVDEMADGVAIPQFRGPAKLNSTGKIQHKMESLRWDATWGIEGSRPRNLSASGELSELDRI